MHGGWKSRSVKPRVDTCNKKRAFGSNYTFDDVIKRYTDCAKSPHLCVPRASWRTKISYYIHGSIKQHRSVGNKGNHLQGGRATKNGTNPCNIDYGDLATLFWFGKMHR